MAKQKSTSRPVVRASDGAAIRPWQEHITAEHIPNGCICTWSHHSKQPQQEVYHLKFRNALCTGRHA